MDADNSSSLRHAMIDGAVDIIHVTLCIFFTLISVLGNVFVIATITKTQNLRTVSNSFVLSLAVTDFLVALLILPLGIQYLIFKHWYLGRVLCILWVCIDVLLITASILSLCAISIDRYRAIKQPIKYSVRRTPVLAAKIMVGVWTLSAVVSVPAVFVVDYSGETFHCGLQRNAVFTICSSFVSFYGPLTVVLFVYVKIYHAAKERANRIGGNGTTVSMAEVSDDTHPKLRRQTTLQRLKYTFSRRNLFMTSTGIPDGAATSGVGAGGEPGNVVYSRISTARERKAARTIAIIVGVFIACWLPFFIMHVTLSVCPNCYVSDQVYVIISWIGYWNSAVNPVIYTLFNKDFRRAFEKLLRCKALS